MVHARYVLQYPSLPTSSHLQIETTLGPMQLLDELQAVENRMGRVKVIDKGPRNIDLDILLYEDVAMKNERLQLPHALMLEREFVLRPLCECV
jgi:2-amino-4-hydroxy-6-hydroxymethyldihydropteridine diphosphokinase/dihydropteroate synthase